MDWRDGIAYFVLIWFIIYWLPRWYFGPRFRLVEYLINVLIAALPILAAIAAFVWLTRDR